MRALRTYVSAVTSSYTCLHTHPHTGDVLGDPDQFNIDVCTAYAHLNDYTDMELDNAIREFLTTFRYVCVCV
jgi:hypothetical protein